MNALGSDTAFLLAQFREFCREMIRIKRLVESGTWVLPPEGMKEEAEERATPGTPIWQRLLSLLQEQELAVGRIPGDFGFGLYKEAQYVMAALADETFLHLEWAGKEFWRSNLLETKLFGTHVAGELLFKKLEKLLHNRDPLQTDLAAMYLMALSLGFRGKFYGVDDRGQLDGYRRDLFTFIFQRNADLFDDSSRLVPEAYAHTLEEGTGRRLPNPRRWMMALAAVVLGLGVLSHVLWTNLSAHLVSVTQAILGQ